MPKLRFEQFGIFFMSPMKVSDGSVFSVNYSARFVWWYKAVVRGPKELWTLLWGLRHRLSKQRDLLRIVRGDKSL